MTLAITLLDKQVTSNEFYFAPTTSGVLKEIFKKSCSISDFQEEPLKEHPSLLNNDIKPLEQMYLHLEEHEFKEKAVAFIKSTTHVAIIAGLVMSAFFGTSGLLPLGLVVAWFVWQIWTAYDVMQKVDAIESFNPERKECAFPFTGLMFLALLPIAPLWEVYTRKNRIEEVLVKKLEEAMQFFAEGEDTRYLGITYPNNKDNRPYRKAIFDLLQLQLICKRFCSHLMTNLKSKKVPISSISVS